MNRKSMNRNEAFKKMKAGIKSLELKFEKPKQRCSFEWKCKDVVCRFDHSFLNHKINVPPSFTSLTRFSFSSCDKKFKAKADLEAHMQKSHTSFQTNAENCVLDEVCKNVSPSKSHLRKHKMKVDENGPIECNKCSQYLN